MAISNKHALENRNFVWNANTLTWDRMIQADASGVTDSIDIASDSVGLARQNQLPASLGQKAMSASLPVVIASDQTSTTYAVKITYSGSITYVARAIVGASQASSIWQALKMDETTGAVVTWADGNANFDNAATDLTALSYS